MKLFRLASFLVAGIIMGAGGAVRADSGPGRDTTLFIKPQPVADALRQFAQQSGLQVVFYSQIGAGIQSPGISGEYSAEAALDKLLAHTDLAYEFINARTVEIMPTKTHASANPQNTSALETSPELVRLAQAEQGTNADFSRANGDSRSFSEVSENSATLQEVVVTAQKTGVAERLQEVPIPMSVVGAQTLVQSNEGQIQDYFNQIPGLTFAEASDGVSIVSIRGITTGGNTNPTTGYTLDDVPLGASTLGGALGQVPTINPADLAQIEVLRGPQGTLYGANSMGGLIRYVTVDPSTDHVFGDIRVGGDGVFRGTHTGYTASAAANLPVTDTLAVRVSAFTRLDPGYIDNVETGERGTNTTKAGGGRFAGLWRISPDFSIKFSALYEKSNRYGSDDIAVPTAGYPNTLGLGDLQQYDLRGTGAYDQTFQTYNITLTGAVGGATLTAVSGYTINGFTSPYDYSFALASLAVPFGGNAASLYENNNVHKFTEEIRLQDTLGSHLEWLLGAFYTHEGNRYIEYVNSNNATTGAQVGTVGNIYYADGPGFYREYAGFGDLTVKITDQFDVQIGGRESHLSETALEGYQSGSLVGGYSPSPEFTASENSFTYLVSPRFKLTPNAMVYARIANGFRPGGGNGDSPPTSYCVENREPCVIDPDKIVNYEIGAKADFFNHTLSVDSSVYYIEWKNIQVTLTDGNDQNYAANGARAKSQGLDVTLEWTPLVGLTVSSWGAWNRAELTESFAYAAAGQPLPLSSRFSGNVSLEKDLLITGNVYAFFMAKEIYVGDRTGEFTALLTPRQDLPAYAQTNLNSGLKLNPWTFNLYVNNATDRRGRLYGGLGASTPFAFDFITPRTIGLSADRTF